MNDAGPPVDDDDAPIGRVLSRREVLTLLGFGVGAVILVACVPDSIVSLAASPRASASAPAGAGGSSDPTASGVATIPSCVVRPELTEGPYFVDELLDRSDIRSDPSTGDIRDGAQLALAFAVSRIDGSTCEAFEGAVVDVWHCDADGIYSDVSDPGFDTSGQTFLRGYQVTDANGRAAFTTIYPGWYSGRTVHIHFKIRTEPGASSGLEFTSQLFFDDSLSDAVFAQDPYAAKGDRDTRNDDDGIYAQSGDQLTLAVTPDGDGYAATFEIGVQVS